MNKTILVVGAGFGQLPAIKTAKDMGLTVVVVDKNPNAIGMPLANYAYPVDIIDFNGVLAIAKKHKIDGIVTMQSDLPVPTIGFVNDKLGLHGISFQTANACSNKIKTRKLLKEKGCSQPAFEIVKDLPEILEAVQSIGFPCIIKAPDSSGSRGVTKVNSIRDVENAFNEAFKYTKKDEIIVEEYIDGLELGAQAFSIDGKCKSVLLHSDILSNPPYMIPIGHSFPFELLGEVKEQEAINDIKEAVEALGVSQGPTNVDLIFDLQEKKVKIIEIGARIGATCLPELVKYYSGIDWVRQSILSCLGEKVDLQVKFSKPVTAFIIQSPQDGILKSYKFPSFPDNKEKLLEYEITAHIGDKVNKLRKGTDRIGKVIYYGATVQESIDSCKDFIEHTEINIYEA
ncbi:MAG: ATP-grasp domain-containing protein [Bacteroidaceae bacterium]|jgi:biotin carboxylase|nr:ATP-grasp domain-containing protein [Bacteroidaceae bacterium]